MSHASLSASLSNEELKYAIKYGRCLACDGVEYPGHAQECTCCRICGNHETESCVCCKHCRFTLDQCRCDERIRYDVWKEWHECIYCDCEDDDEDYEVHVGKSCPYCCAYCKNHKSECKCCKKCGTTPCICCTICGDLRINCKCRSVRILSHFMKRSVRSVHYHKMEQQLRVCPCTNTAALLMVIE